MTIPHLASVELNLKHFTLVATQGSILTLVNVTLFSL